MCWLWKDSPTKRTIYDFLSIPALPVETHAKRGSFCEVNTHLKWGTGRNFPCLCTNWEDRQSEATALSYLHAECPLWQWALQLSKWASSRPCVCTHVHTGSLSFYPREKQGSSMLFCQHNRAVFTTLIFYCFFISSLTSFSLFIHFWWACLSMPLKLPNHLTYSTFHITQKLTYEEPPTISPDCCNNFPLTLHYWTVHETAS